MEAEVITAIAASMACVLSGYGISFGVGIMLAVISSLSPYTKNIILPIANVCRPVSAIALYPLIVTFIGIGFWARVFVLTWVSLPVVLINTLHALETIPREIIDAARLETNNSNIVFLVRLPMSYKSIVSTLNVTISTTWIGLTAAEMLGASDGLGFKILEAAQSFNYPVMFTYIAIIAGLGFIMSQSIQKVYNRLENLQ